MNRLIVVKFHSNIANRWLFIIQRKIMAIIFYSKSYFDMFRVAVFFRTRCKEVECLTDPAWTGIIPLRSSSSFVSPVVFFADITPAG